MRDLIGLLVFISSLAVYLDARKIGIKKETLPGFIGSMTPGRWFIACLIIWIIYFPAYMMKRAHYCRVLNHPETRWFYYFGYSCLAAAILLIIAACVGSSANSNSYQATTLSCSEALPHVKQALLKSAKERGINEEIVQLGPATQVSADPNGEFLKCSAALVTSKDHYTADYKVFWGNKSHTEAQMICEIE